MRLLVLASTIALAACSREVPKADATRQPATVNTPAAANTSPDARAAVAVVAAYLNDLHDGDYAAARALWADGGAASGGSAADLKRAYAAYSRFDGQAGEATEIKTASGTDFIIVTADAHPIVKKTNKERHLAGTINLRRPAGGAAPAEGERDWRIWSVDLRRPH